MSSKQQTRNGDENNNNDNNNQYYWAMDEEERLEYHQSIVAYVSIAFAVVYTILSFTAYCEGVSIPELLAEDADSWQNLSHTEIAKGSTFGYVTTFMVVPVSSNCVILSYSVDNHGRGGR